MVYEYSLIKNGVILKTKKCQFKEIIVFEIIKDLAKLNPGIQEIDFRVRKYKKRRDINVEF